MNLRQWAAPLLAASCIFSGACATAGASVADRSGRLGLACRHRGDAGDLVGGWQRPARLARCRVCAGKASRLFRQAADADRSLLPDQWCQGNHMNAAVVNPRNRF